MNHAQQQDNINLNLRSIKNEEQKTFHMLCGSMV